MMFGHSGSLTSSVNPKLTHEIFRDSEVLGATTNDGVQGTASEFTFELEEVVRLC
jgi:hypothetical protein